MSWVTVGNSGEFQDGEVTVVKAAGREIGVVRWRDRLYALRNVCPHESGPLCLGRVLEWTVGGDQLGDVVAREDRPVLVCPWHGWEFDLATGAAVADPVMRVRTYPVNEADGVVAVSVGGAPDG
jgi:nitrite reductase/ring-hydroxylating ferredoxin subunit